MKAALLSGILIVLSGLAHAQEPPGERVYLCTDEQAKTDETCPAQVVLVRHGWVVVEAGRPLRVGERLRLLSQPWARRMDRKTLAEESVPIGAQTGTLVVERVRGSQGAGRLVRNAYAKLGDLALPTRRFRESLIYGPRFPNTWRVRGDVWLGPAFGQGTGTALWTQTAVEYRFGVPLKLAVELGPGIVVSGLRFPVSNTGMTFSSGTVIAGSLRGVVGLAFSGFELSLGLGGQLDTGRATRDALQMGIGVRLGSLDGFNVTYDNYFFLPIDRRPAEFDSAAAAVNIPVHRRTTLVVSAAGGTPFWVHSTLGFRIYAHGTGGPGTTIINLSFGGFGVTERRECPPPTTASLGCVPGSTTAGGPLFHLGFDHRF